MKIKYVIAMILAGLISCGYAQNPVVKAFVTVRVVAQDGSPVMGAEVYGAFEYSYYEGDSFRGITDTNGCIMVSGRLMNTFNAFAKKEGYYETSEVFRWETRYLKAEISDGKWHPWNPIVEMVLKDKRNPVSLFCRKITRTNIPLTGNPIGFDLFKSDWVKPYGDGIVSDLLVTATNDYREFRDFDVNYSVSFSNSKDGFVRFDKPEFGSRLISNQSAPKNGYVSIVTWKYGRKGNENVYSTGDTDNVNYYFRIRTKKDDKGKIIQAYYGKIYRGIRIKRNRDNSLNLSFQYYLNRKSMDRNVEYDMKNNLSIPSGLSPLERRDPLYSVNQP